MSRVKISPYPTLPAACVAERLGASVVFRYMTGGTLLDVETIKDGHCRIVSPSWRPRSDALTVSASIEIAKPELLFSVRPVDSDCRIASGDARIGVSLKWVLPETKVRGVEVATSVLTSSNKGKVKVYIEHKFPPAFVRNRAELDVGLFLSRPGSSKDDIFARTVGSELGSLGANVLHTGGSGGMFPTTAAHLGAAAPLWDLAIHIDDALDLERDFSGDVCMLCLNEDHALYQELVRAEINGAISPLMFEIFSESCVMLLMAGVKCIERIGDLDDKLADDGDGMSTMSVLRYMKRRLLPDVPAGQLEAESPQNLSRMIRLALAKQMKVSVPVHEKKEGGLF